VHGLVQVLTGSVEVSEPAGAMQIFHPEQVFFIPQGTDHAMPGSDGFSAYLVRIGQTVRDAA
jgi:quercetin dioxygenase-like cupin family protein